MILLHFPNYQCHKCYAVIDSLIVSKGPNSNVNEDQIEFKHPLQNFIECEDQGKVLATLPVQNFLISDFHA